MFSCECLEDVGDFGVVVFGVSVGVLSVLVDDLIGVLEDFGAGGGLFFIFVGHGCFSLSVLGLLGCFQNFRAAVLPFFRVLGCKVFLVLFGFLALSSGMCP